MNLKFNQLSLTLGGRTVLDKIQLDLPPEQLIMVLGANGAGKTRLLKTALGFHQPQQGAVYYGEQPLSALSTKARAQQVAYLPQERQNNVHMPVLDFVLLGCVPHLAFYQAPSQGMREQALETLAQLQIPCLAHCFMDEISGGEAQLCYLARARMQNTPWLILDEPITALDFEKQHLFLQLLKKTMRNQKKSVLMSIHEPTLACNYADILLFMQEGRILDILHTSNPSDMARLEPSLQALYGAHVGLENTTVGPTIVWKENLT